MTKYVACRRRKRVYHTDKDCHRLADAKNYEETSEEMIERRGLEFCGTCEGDHETDAYVNSFQKDLKQAAEGDD